MTDRRSSPGSDSQRGAPRACRPSGSGSARREVSRRSYSSGSAASKCSFERHPSRHAPPLLLRAARIAQRGLAARNRYGRLPDSLSAACSERPPPADMPAAHRRQPERRSAHESGRQTASARPPLVSATGDYEPRDHRRSKTPRRPYRPSPVILRWGHRRSRGDIFRAAASVFPRGESEPRAEMSGGLADVLSSLRRTAPGAIICA